MSDLIEFKADIGDLRENVVDVLASGHGLHAIGKELVGDVPSERAETILIDVEFARQQPDLPIENVLSRLDNYQPANFSQQQMLERAGQLSTYRNPMKTAGLIICGSAGIGKTHISVGVAKLAMLTGQKATYINASAPHPPSFFRGLATGVEQTVEENDIIIADDVNSPFNWFGSRIFADILTAMHNKGGGKLLVTSNFDNHRELIDKVAAVSSHHERAAMARLYDRIAGALLGMEVEGESFRRMRTEHQVPWFIEQEGLEEPPI